MCRGIPNTVLGEGFRSAFVYKMIYNLIKQWGFCHYSQTYVSDGWTGMPAGTRTLPVHIFLDERLRYQRDSIVVLERTWYIVSPVDTTHREGVNGASVSGPGPHLFCKNKHRLNK